MSITVAIDELYDEIGAWSFCYLLTVREDRRVHLLAVHPSVVGSGEARRLRIDAGGGRACANAASRPDVSLVFPPEGGHDGYSLVVDGVAAVDGDSIEIAPTSAVLHRPAT